MLIFPDTENTERICLKYEKSYFRNMFYKGNLPPNFDTEGPVGCSYIFMTLGTDSIETNFVACRTNPIGSGIKFSQQTPLKFCACQVKRVLVVEYNVTNQRKFCTGRSHDNLEIVVDLIDSYLLFQRKQ